MKADRVAAVDPKPESALRLVYNNMGEAMFGSMPCPKPEIAP